MLRSSGSGEKAISEQGPGFEKVSRANINPVPEAVFYGESPSGFGLQINKKVIFAAFAENDSHVRIRTATRAPSFSAICVMISVVALWQIILMREKTRQQKTL
jgi:hypothetical protein